MWGGACWRVMSRAEQERAHGAFQSLPVVDVAGLYSAELDGRKATARVLGAACREAGFFYLTGHRVAGAAIDGLLAQAQAFFSLPGEQKLEYYIGK
jgi:isopenicillin N synthase-like dioxygenase